MATAAGLRAVVIAWMLNCAACPGTLEDPQRFLEGSTSDCPDVPTTLFATRCATAGCHSAMDKAQGLDLESPDVASRLVGVKATGGAGYLINPADPSMSVVYTKLTQVPPFGARMPLVGRQVDDATIACVLAWASENVGDASLPPDDGPPDDATTGSTDTGPELDGAASSSGGGGPDARSGEAAAPDAGPRDASAPRDAGRPESGTPDAGPPDSSGQDGAPQDAATG